MRRVGITLAALTTLTTLAVPAASSALASSQPASAHPATATKATAKKPAAPQIRLNQVGYQPTAPKTAYVMLPARVASVPFTVTDANGKVVYRGVSRDDVGAWNAGYQAVYLLSFSGLHRCGTYQVRAANTVSPTFTIANGTALYGPLVDNAVRYFTSERDGADVEHDVLSREPANLTDEKADVYAAPRYDDNDNLLGTLKKVGGPVNVSGGWFDAGGGYEKFGYTASYADALMLIAARDNPGAIPDAEAGGGVRAAVDHQALEPEPEGPLHAGRDRQRQRLEHDPGRLQLLVPAAAGGPARRGQGRQPRPDRLLRQVPAGVRGGPARPEGQPGPGRAVRGRLRPRRPARARRCRHTTTCNWPARSTPTPRRPTSGRS